MSEEINYNEVVRQVRTQLRPLIETLLVASWHTNESAYKGAMDVVREVIIEIIKDRFDSKWGLNVSKASRWLNINRGTMRSIIKRL